MEDLYYAVSLSMIESWYVNYLESVHADTKYQSFFFKPWLISNLY
jgi:hypothetical protein